MVCGQDELKTSWYSVSHDLRYVLLKYDVREVTLFYASYQFASALLKKFYY